MADFSSKSEMYESKCKIQLGNFFKTTKPIDIIRRIINLIQHHRLHYFASCTLYYVVETVSLIMLSNKLNHPLIVIL